jgi:hypothetical protein
LNAVLSQGLLAGGGVLGLLVKHATTSDSWEDSGVDAVVLGVSKAANAHGAATSTYMHMPNYLSARRTYHVDIRIAGKSGACHLLSRPEPRAGGDLPLGAGHFIFDCSSSFAFVKLVTYSTPVTAAEHIPVAFSVLLGYGPR